MGCETYHSGDFPIRFSEMNDDIGCLCTFPHNDFSPLCKERVRSLAYLGAAVVLAQRDLLDDGYLPNCLPERIRKGIDEALGI